MVKESSANDLTMELPKPQSEGLARLAASAHLHYRVGSSQISEEIIRPNVEQLQAHTYTTGGSRIVAVILSSVWSETHRPLWITIRPRIYTSESAKTSVGHFQISRRTWIPGNGNTRQNWRVSQPSRFIKVTLQKNGGRGGEAPT